MLARWLFFGLSFEVYGTITNTFCTEYVYLCQYKRSQDLIRKIFSSFLSQVMGNGIGSPMLRNT